MDVGGRLKLIRRHFGLNQEKFAKMLKIKMFSVTRYENDVTTPSLDTLQMLRKKFGVNIHWLLNGEGAMLGETPGVTGDARDEYKAGDIVELVSGSNPMTVINVREKTITCTWPDSDFKMQVQDFPSVALKKVEG